MKKTLKNLMAVGIGGISMFSAFAFGGCGEQSGYKINTNNFIWSSMVNSDLYIIVDGTLHKGDIYCFYTAHAGTSLTGLDLYCGGDGFEVITNDVRAYNKNFKPDEKQYDKVCEKCFGE